MAERLPIAPKELEAEEHAALEAIKHEKTLQAHLANVPTWRAQLTGRGLTVGLVLGAMFTIVVHKLNLGVGIIPSLNIAAGLLSFCSLKIWQVLSKQLWPNTPTRPFGAQECNVVQTFITACSSVAFTGGFGSYLTAMDRRSYNLLGGDSAQGNREEDIYEPSLYRVIPYLLCTSVIGVFMLVALRKTMIIDYDLTYPSGTATGLMIDSFFTQRGQETAGKQLTQMGRFFGISVAWDAFKWLFSGADCTFCSLTTICGGFEKFPIFGMVAAKWTFYANFTPNIIGAGMICPHIVNLSMVLGAILTWGFLWPYIASKEGVWFDAGQDDTSFAGLFGYKLFLTIALLMGDGLYSLSKVMAASFRAYCATKQQQQQWAPSSPSCATRGNSSSDAGDDAADEAAATAAPGLPGFWGSVCWRVARVSAGVRDAVLGRSGSVWLGNSSIKANEGFNVRGGVSELPGEGHPTHDHGHIYTHAHGHTHAHTLSPTGCCVSGNVCIGGSSSEGSWDGHTQHLQEGKQGQCCWLPRFRSAGNSGHSPLLSCCQVVLRDYWLPGSSHHGAASVIWMRPDGLGCEQHDGQAGHLCVRCLGQLTERRRDCWAGNGRCCAGSYVHECNTDAGLPDGLHCAVRPKGHVCCSADRGPVWCPSGPLNLCPVLGDWQGW